MLDALPQTSIPGKGWTIIDTSGHIFSSMIDYEEIGVFHEGAAVARNGKSWMLIDKYGNRLTRDDYEIILYGGEDLWVIGNDEKFGIATSKGKVVHEPKYDQLFDYGEGKFVVKKGKYYGYTDRKGDILIKPQYDEAFGFENGYAVVNKKGLYGLIDHDNQPVIPIMYEKLFSYRDGLLGFSGDGLYYGFLDIENDTVILPIYTIINSFRDGRASVTMDPLNKRRSDRNKEPEFHYIDKSGEKSANQRDTLYLDATYFPVEIDSLNWTYVNQNGDTLFKNEFYKDDKIHPNPFDGDHGLAAIYVDLHSISRPDQQGLSPWGKYELKDYFDGMYKLYFEALQNTFEIRETVTGEYIVSARENGSEALQLQYVLKEKMIFLDSVFIGRNFFDLEEIDYQSNNGRYFTEADHVFMVITDMLVTLFKPIFKYFPSENEWSANRGSGRGLQLVAGGLIYHGQVSDSLRNGSGLVINPEEYEFHLGKWSSNLREGEFEIYAENGTRVQANYMANQPSGTWYFHNGLGKIEKVDYEDGKEKSRYRVRSVREPSAVTQSIEGYQFRTTYFGNAFYAGFVKDDQWFRWGKYQYDEGSYYKGQWEDNQKQGYGEMHWFDGEIYAGQWEADEQTGWCTIYYPNGSRYDGQVKESKYHGYGIFRYSNGNIIKGQYYNGVVHDTSEVSFISGKIEQRIFDHGKLLEKSTLREIDEKAGIGISVGYDREKNHFVIRHVQGDCSAETVGLKNGDVLYEVDGVAVKDFSMPELRELLMGLPGKVVNLYIYRDGQYHMFKVIRDQLSRS